MSTTFVWHILTCYLPLNIPVTPTKDKNESIDTKLYSKLASKYLFVDQSVGQTKRETSISREN